MPNAEWFFEEEDDEEDFSVKEYDVTATPNDFNIKYSTSSTRDS
jgi:hypothetical protein